MYEEVYCQYYDTAGNYHWCGTATGKHIVPIDGANHSLPYSGNFDPDKYMIADDSKGIPQM